MAKQKPLTVTLHIGGKQVERLTEEQTEKMAKKLSEAMSIYYTANADEYVKMRG